MTSITTQQCRKRSQRARRISSSSDDSDTDTITKRPRTSHPNMAGSPEPSLPVNRRDKYEKRYKVDERSDSEVLGKSSFYSFSCSSSLHPKELQRATWTSEVYAHYKAPVVTREGDKVVYKFLCKRYRISRINFPELLMSYSTAIRLSQSHAYDTTRAPAILYAMQAAAHQPKHQSRAL